MWGLDSLGLPISITDGVVTAPVWLVGATAVLLVVLFILALVRTGLAGTLIFVTVVGFGGWGVYAWSEQTRVQEQRALEQRLRALDVATFTPGTALSCLGDVPGDAVQRACERAVFATPEATAGAATLTAARLALLQDAVVFTRSRDPSFETTLNGLRAALEVDHFGFVAHVLTVRYGCTATNCDILRLLRDSSRIRGNIRNGTFDANLARARANWPAAPAAAATSAPADPVANAMGVPSNLNFPSAASIPPVSIMNNEPGTSGAAPSAPPGGAPASAAPAAAPPPPPRRPARTTPARRAPAETAPEARRP